MKIELDTDKQTVNRITAYTDKTVTLNNTVVINNNCVISANNILEDWCVKSIDDMQTGNFDDVISLEPEIILLGTGRESCIPRAEICAYLHEKRIGFEFMQSGAAIRSYNVLLGESRKVALALILS